jgi:hypothetical protein
MAFNLPDCLHGFAGFSSCFNNLRPGRVKFASGKLKRMIPVLGFVVSLPVVFAISTFVIGKVEKSRAELNELRAWKTEQQRRVAAAQRDRAWRANKQMVMD